MHSIRKGAATYISACPGGTSSGSISVNGGWSMGRVKDIDVQWYEHLWGVLMWLVYPCYLHDSLPLPYVFKSETYGNETTKAAVFPMMLLCMYQLMYYPVYQEGPAICAHSVQVARFLFIDSRTRKRKGYTPKIVEPLNFAPL